MSVLIKGMEMPTRCAVCVLCDLRYGTKCKITKMSYYDSEGYPRGGYNGRPDWCPLVEIPEPHGDLIDRDALNIGEYEREDDDTGTLEISLGGLLNLYHKAKGAPMVIEAEGGKNP